jgi:serine protease DegQ
MWVKPRKVNVPAERLTAMPFGDSRQLEVGDFVFAIGYPANIGQSVTSGIVSGLHRSNIGIEEFENFIQTDAAIYPGNSGGALVDLQGDLVGINTAFIGATSSNPGMGFAIPVNMARTIIDQIMETGEIRRGSLGITIDDPTPDVIRELQIISAPRGGAIIVKVDQGSIPMRSQPGEKLGLLGGEFLWGENAFLVQVGQPLDLGENVGFLGSLGTMGRGIRRGGGCQA